jgi:hypothetical protein
MTDAHGGHPRRLIRLTELQRDGSSSAPAKGVPAVMMAQGDRAMTAEGERLP